MLYCFPEVWDKGLLPLFCIKCYPDKEEMDIKYVTLQADFAYAN